MKGLRKAKIAGGKTGRTGSRESLRGVVVGQAARCDLSPIAI